VFGVLFLLIGVVLLVGTTSIRGVLIAISTIGIASLLLPPARAFVYSKTGKQLSVKSRAVFIFILLVLFGVMVTDEQKIKEQELAVQQAHEKAENATKIRQKAIDHFKTNRSKIISSVKDKLTKKEYQSAITESSNYLVSEDEELNNLNIQAKKELAELKEAERIKRIEEEQLKAQVILKAQAEAKAKEELKLKAHKEAKAKVITILMKEPKVRDALWTDENVLKVGVFDDGTNRKGYAEYVCLVINENGFKNQRTMIQIIDIAKLVQTGEWVKLGETFCN
jgi:hypothetical protein